MKGRKKAVVICLAAMLYCAVTGQQAFASAAGQDGLKVELTKNQESYGKEERIEATLTVTNTNMNPVNNVLLEEFIPEGYQAEKGSSTTKSAESLGKGESVTLTVVCIPEEPGKPGRPDGNNAEAGGENGPEKEPDILGSQTQHTGNPAMLAPLSAGPDETGSNGLLAGRGAGTFRAEKNDETGLKVSVSGAAGTGFQEKVPSAADRGDVGAIIREDRESAENVSGTAAVMLALLGSGLAMAAVLAGVKKKGRLRSGSIKQHRIVFGKRYGFGYAVSPFDRW